MSGVRLIQVPYHLGRKGEVLGAGTAPLADAIGGDSVTVERPGPFRNEIGASVDIARMLSEVVRETIAAGLFPLVLAGNCSSALGTVTGLDREVGVVWFDAHGDLHTPGTSPTGFFDGMALAGLTGAGWEELRRGLKTVPREHVVLVGARDFDPSERLEGLTRADAASLESALDTLDVDAVYVHIDLDVLDPSEGRANGWAVEGGFSADELERALDSITSRFEIAAAAFTAYDPACDEEARIPRVAARLAPHLLEAEVAS
ncbi:MAG: arginase family protein [Actinobacteria bacterium]|nr:arginase family protein [Actinomycetota bacterium]